MVRQNCQLILKKSELKQQATRKSLELTWYVLVLFLQCRVHAQAARKSTSWRARRSQTAHVIGQTFQMSQTFSAELVQNAGQHVRDFCKMKDQC